MKKKILLIGFISLLGLSQPSEASIQQKLTDLKAWFREKFNLKRTSNATSDSDWDLPVQKESLPKKESEDEKKYEDPFDQSDEDQDTFNDEGMLLHFRSATEEPPATLDQGEKNDIKNQLHDAVKKNDLELIGQLIDKNFDIYERDENENTALHEVFISVKDPVNQKEMVKLFLTREKRRNNARNEFFSSKYNICEIKNNEGNNVVELAMEQHENDGNLYKSLFNQLKTHLESDHENSKLIIKLQDFIEKNTFPPERKKSPKKSIWNKYFKP